jgi:hypothetical protein
MKASGSSVVARVCTLAVALLLPVAALADGKVISQRAFAIPQIPDQQALLHYANGTETLVIETTFVGPGTNFAWVVPLPTAPKIQPVSPGLFPTLEVIFQPEVVLSVNHYWLALPIAMFVFVMARRLRRESFSALLCFGLFLILVALLLLPGLGSAGSRAGATGSLAASVHVLNRQPAGLFDTVTIKSADPAALMDWLNENGFSTPTNLAPALAQYTHEGWVFVAARLHQAAGETGARATHPLAFTFQTPTPVYPLRLTGVGAASCRIDLYVFGPARAEVPGFKVQRCETPLYDAPSRRPRLQAGQLHIRHDELRTLVAQAPVATKLRAVLNASDMTHDACVSWKPYALSGGQVFSPGAALTLGANVTALVFGSLLVCCWVLSKTWDGFHAPKWGRRLAPVAIAAGLAVCALALPKGDGMSFRTIRVRGYALHGDLFYLAQALAFEMDDTNVVAVATTPPRPLTSPELERLLRAMARDPQQPALTNTFTGEFIRFQASPGNIVLRPAVSQAHPTGTTATSLTTNGYELVWYDLDGAAAMTNSLPILY